jgi:hypothetical protein
MTSREAAEFYVRNGMCPVPIPTRERKPGIDEV